MACEECLNRRDFLAKSALAGAALAVVGACGDGQIGPTQVSVGRGTAIKIANFPGLASTGTLVDIGDQRAVIRTGPSDFLALSKVCTHEGCETNVINNRFECPCHGSIFADDGSVIRGPSTGGAIAHLQVLATTFDPATGTLTIS